MKSHTYIIAEMSANHCQNYEMAERLVYTAKEVGADAIKLQTYTPDTLTIDCDKPEFVIKGGTPWDNKSLYELYSEAYMPWEWQPKLKKVADNIGIDLFSTPFDKTAVDFLEDMGVSVYKVASFELVDLPLIEYIASKKKPMIMSTGMAILSEIKEAVNVAKNAGATDITLLKCTSAYPALPEDMNLLAIPHLPLQFLVPRMPGLKLSVGLSDHTMGIAVPVVAVALGACTVEKHLTLSRNCNSPDGKFSLEPDEFKAMVEAVRVAEKALGERAIGMTEHESSSKVFRRSLFVVEDMKAGEKFTEQNVRSIRPGYGLSPKYLGIALRDKASQDIEKGTPLQWELLSISG